MSFWTNFVQGSLPYQEYWLPLGIGLIAGSVCLFTGFKIGRGRRRAPQEPVVNMDHDPFVQGSVLEQRKSLRRAGNLVEVLYARPDSRKIVGQALVLDRSIGGLRLVADEEIEPDTRLVVLPRNASEQVPWIEIDVRTCRRVEDSWEWGCQFVKTPQWSILLLFG